MSAVIINVDTALTDVPIIEIGKQGENEATQVVFDVSDMIDTFGSGTAYVVVQRRGDAEPYLLDNTQQSGDKVTWTVSNVDTDVYGMGRVQLFWMIGDQVAKSVNYQFYVEEALGNPTDAPVVPDGWISEKIGDLDELTTTAKENLVAAINEVNALVDGMADDVEGLSTDVEELQEQMETKAEIDGLYEDMTVGNAEQLIASDYVTDKAPYLFRKTGGSTDVGNREYDTLVGASAVWNQLMPTVSKASASGLNGVDVTNNNDGSFTLNGTATGETANYWYLGAYSASDTAVFTMNLGHVYYMSDVFPKYSTTSNTGVFNYVGDALINKGGYFAKATSADFKTRAVRMAGFSTGTTYSNTKIYPKIIDLTTFFGSSTIPDYVYSLEQSTSGSGVAWLRQYFPKLFEYHDYDTGTLKSVEGVESHDMVGFNAYNPTTGKAKVLSGNQYQITGAYTALSLEGTTITPDSSGLFTPTVTGELTVTGGNNSTTCIHLVNSGYRNGEYEPYWKRSYPLDSTWVGRGIYKLGSDGKPYADGDTYASDGSGEVRYGVVDLGSLTWNKVNTPNSHWRFRAILNEVVKAVTTTDVFNGICTKYISVSPSNTFDGATGVSNNHASNAIFICDENYTDATVFKTAMSGIYLIYELATPTSATYEPFQSPQICDDFGTEEYVTDCLIPVGHETRYPANLRDKVQHLPDLSNLGNGNYIVNQTGTQMSLIPITSIIPAVPTEDGTYMLKCAVASGQATLSWEVEE